MAGGLSGCRGTPDPAAGSSPPTADSARKLSLAEQKVARLSKELNRLRAQSPTQGTATHTAPPPAPGTRSGSTPLAAGAGLRAGFDSLASRLGGSEGVAFASVGGVTATGLGSWRTGPGWSTVKVPLALAVVAKARGKPDVRLQSLIRRAITASDNAAAEQLWTSLGEPAAAAAQVESVLRSAGDRQTRVQSRRVRPGFSAFGQTTWSLAGQATFAAALPCLKSGNFVLPLMGQVEPGQRWGIGAVGLPAQFKGGWGPGPGGGYLVRQMGIVTLPDGSRIALSLASQPADGRFETGTANLTALARWAVANVRPAGKGTC
jgi:hypothetical protein